MDQSVTDAELFILLDDAPRPINDLNNTGTSIARVIGSQTGLHRLTAVTMQGNVELARSAPIDVNFVAPEQTPSLPPRWATPIAPALRAVRRAYALQTW